MMNPAIQAKVTIPCSKCGDSLRVFPHELEEDQALHCPRCDQDFIPSKILIEMVTKMVKNDIENGS
jgi:DNA-directed RNA polymerase subunit RPC12/RpoP